MYTRTVCSILYVFAKEQSHQLLLLAPTIECFAQHYTSSSWSVAYDPKSSAGGTAF